MQYMYADTMYLPTIIHVHPGTVRVEDPCHSDISLILVTRQVREYSYALVDLV